MPTEQIGTTIQIFGLTARVDNDGKWNLPVPPASLPDSDCSKEQFYGRLFTQVTKDLASEYSPANGEPSVYYAEGIIRITGSGKIIHIVRGSLPSGAVL